MRKNRNTRTLISTCALGLALAGLSMSALAESFDTSVARSIIAQDGMALKMVKADKASLRCGDQDVFYTISELNADTPLRTAGTSGSYTKVIMPDSIGAFVPVNEVEAGSDAKSVRLSVDSKLRAPSHLLGLAGSWKAIYNTPLPAGTDLKVIETLLNDAGKTLGYRVIAPTSPSGELPIAYIKTTALRDATASEISAFDGTGAAPTTLPATKPEPIVEEVAEAVETEAATEEVDASIMEEMDMPSTEPIEIENAAPVEIQEPAATPESTTRTAPSGRITASALEDLEAAFDSARRLPRAQLDATLDELLAEFARTRAQAESGTSLANALYQRLEWIAIRIESRDQRRAIAATLAAYDAKADQVARDIQAWQSGRGYQLVGRMVTSAIYTGEHLPLLYRVQSIDPVSGAARTIGYVAPAADQDFRHLLGRVVGVIGSMNNDDSLKLTVIEPDRIDPMPE